VTRMNEAVNENLVDNGSFWFPAPATELAGQVDQLFWFILWVSLIIMIGIVFVCLLFVFKYRRKHHQQRAKKQVVENIYLELAWTLIPLALVMYVFYWGYIDFVKVSIPPADAVEIRVTGRKWAWQFDYGELGRKTLGDLVVKVNTPIKLIMSSEDILHSFFVPNFRIKRDVVPNRYTRVWFEANRVGDFQIFCTEFCGDGHSNMMGSVRVLSNEDYEKWVEGVGEDTSVSLLDLGRKLYSSKGCNACHTLDGSVGVGPSWKGLYGSLRTFVDGTSAKVDGNYIRESIVDPGAKIVNGFQANMTSFSGLLSDREIDGIIDYIKSIKR